MLVRY